MSNFFVDHAIKNVWCNPQQDNQYILAAAKISANIGEVGVIDTPGKTLDLPSEAKYHIYQVGQLYPAVIGLLSRIPEWSKAIWIPFSKAMNELDLFVDFYTSEGISIPRFNSYFIFTNERNLLFAIPEDKNIPVIHNLTTVYVRLYTNAYYQLPDTNVEDYKIYTKGAVVKTVEDIIELQDEYNLYKDRIGYTYSYCNGQFVNAIDLVNVRPGDTAEFIYDPSVKRLVEFTVKDLPVFGSILDRRNKYLLHHKFGNNDTIDYMDDIDIYIIHQKSNSHFIGGYYNRNDPSNIRMVTHRDYSIAVDSFHYIANNLVKRISSPNNTIDLRSLKVFVIIRNSGYHRPLIYDNNRIFELYKLPDDKILQAMVGVNSTLDIWKAANLEASAYTELMRVEYEDVTLDLVERAYGYNSMSCIAGMTPTKATLDGNKPYIKLNNILVYNSTFYEYDEDGYLLEYNSVNYANNYFAGNTKTRLIEGISGIGSDKPDVRFGKDNIEIPDNCSFKVYYQSMIGDKPEGDWIDITNSGRYEVTNGKLKWLEETQHHMLMVRTDLKFLAYDVEITTTNGTFEITLKETVIRNGNPVTWELPIPLGELDIFLNGKSLIEGLDYFIDFPKVIIVNKNYLNQPADEVVQKLHIRYTGFCESDMKVRTKKDYGFIEHGVLSKNNRFDLRDDKVLRITVDGKLLDRTDVKFAEEDSGVSIVNSVNGLPYQIKDIVVPLRNLVNTDTYVLRERSEEIDEKVSDYLTLLLPEPVREPVSAMEKQYIVVSPFLSRIVSLLKQNIILSDSLVKPMTTNDIITICRPYEYLLKYDPVNIDNKIDYRFVMVHPYINTEVVNLDIYQYKFLMKVVEVYAGNKVQLSHFITFNA